MPIKRLVTTECPVDKTLKFMGSRWTTLILHNLFDGTKRFGELQKLMKGISSKTLSERLQMLEKEGIITKKIFPEIPLHVEYTLTEKGKSFGDILTQMAEWGSKH